MVEIDEDAVDVIVHEGSAMSVRDMVTVFERYHRDGPGIPLAAVEEYAAELDSKPDYRLDVDGFVGDVRERLTADEDWVDMNHFYELDGGRISQYPATWHAELGEETDPVRYLRFLRERAPEYHNELQEGGQGVGVPKDTLTKMIEVLGRVDRDVAVGAIEEAYGDDRIGEEPDQHPQADVYLPEGAEERRD
ncbi:hypothetical protein [Halomicrobium salinisoli]|uniref:hypothetical protein n=1 Tax=Halomicrobium salinisoli TaxID=2878391 RepID=UPI001CF0891A|nr:hypothetical protein [Halomicrobium salinisoli]